MLSDEAKACEAGEAKPFPEAAGPKPSAEAEAAAAAQGEDLHSSVGGTSMRMEAPAYCDIAHEFIAAASIADPLQSCRGMHELARATDLGICVMRKCQCGCANSDAVKAWGWACRLTLWLAASEAARPSAKPCGMPTS